MTTIAQSIREYEPLIVEHIQALIQIRSVYTECDEPGKPYGEGIHQALQYMLDLGASMGFQTANVDGYAGHVEYGSGNELVAVLVHLDTVPEGSGWTFEPFGAQIHEGRIYGRGASDDKGPAVVALYALKALKDLGIHPKKRVRIIFGTNEENGMTDMDHYFAKEPTPDYAFTPDAGYPIINAEKGYYVIRLKGNRCTSNSSGGGGNGNRCLLEMTGGVAPNVVPEQCYTQLTIRSDEPDKLDRIRELAESHSHIKVRLLEEDRVGITALGKSGHGSYPPSGINAISHMLEFLNAISSSSEKDGEGLDPFLDFIRCSIGFEAFGESLGLACSDPVHGKLTVNLAQIHVDDRNAEAILNLRYPVTVVGETIIAKLREVAVKAGIEVEVTAYLAPLYIPPDDPLIKKLSVAYETVTGEKAGLLSIGGGTYARKLQNRGVAFGSGFQGTDTRAHQPDEFIVIEEIMRHAEICTQAIYELIQVEET